MLEAKERFGVGSWPGQDAQAHMDLADWWHGLQRVPPGSASGTQSQKAWHRHKLKKHIGSLRQSLDTLDALLKCLGEFTQTRLKDLQATEGELPDVPIEPFPDKHVLLDTPSLTSQGRSSRPPVPSDQELRCLVG